MTRAFARLGAVLLAGALAACQTASGEDPAANAGRTWGTDAHGLAQAACAGCHSVEPFGLSPNPMAPEFPAIANTSGLTVATLTNWLRNAHNYPAEMDFQLGDEEVTLLVDYILTLRREGYEPPIQ